MARIAREFDEMWAEASDETKEVYSREHLDKIIRDTDAAAAGTYPTLTPVIDAIVDALTSGDPEYRYIDAGSNRLLDKYCVRGLLFFCRFF